MKKEKIIIVFLMLTMFWNMDLKAAGEAPTLKKSVSGELIILMNKDDGVIGAGLDFQYRLIAQVGIGLDIILGMDSDGAAYTVLLPNASYHFLPLTKTWDLFAGLGASLVVNKPSFVNSDFGTTLFGFAGAKVNFSRHMGCTFRVFLGPRLIGGGSVALTYSF